MDTSSSNTDATEDELDIDPIETDPNLDSDLDLDSDDVSPVVKRRRVVIDLNVDNTTSNDIEPETIVLLSKYGVDATNLNDYQLSAVPALVRGLKSLNSFQDEIILECLTRGSGGLSLVMGSGKTLVSLVLGLVYLMRNPLENYPSNPYLFVASITLVSSCMYEIERWFGKTLRYQVLQTLPNRKTSQFRLDPKTHVLLVTHPILSRLYSTNGLLRQNLERTVDRDERGFIRFKEYQVIARPVLNTDVGQGVVMSRPWSCFIVDEAQEYSNVESDKCKAAMCIVAKHRWLLSGTMIVEPKVTNILGYYCMLNWPGIPRNIPDLNELIFRRPKGYYYVNPDTAVQRAFEGLKATMVHRDVNPHFNPPVMNKQIVSHSLTPDEAKVYTVFKNVINELNLRLARHARDLQQRIVNPTQEQLNEIERLQREAAEFRAGLMSMITYLRECLVCPMIPMASISLKMANMESRDIVSRLLNDEINKQQLRDYLENPDSMYSSRVRMFLDTLSSQKHANERILVFSSFRTTVDLLLNLGPKACNESGTGGGGDGAANGERKFFTIESRDKMDKRIATLKQYADSPNGIMIGTYDIMANGLNLQCASTVICIDFWWNSSKTTQGTARVNRMGQTAKVINVYFFTSNTTLEQALFKKQRDKNDIISDLMTGTSDKGIHKVSIKELVKILNSTDENHSLATSIYMGGGNGGSSISSSSSGST